MTMTRRSLLRLLSGASAFCLALSQVALAGFACPMDLPAPAQMQHAMANGDCHQAPGPGSKTLCFKTCQDEPQKHDVPSLEVPPVAVDSGLRIPSLGRVLAIDGVARAPDLYRATAPPPRLQYARFLV